jgi:hypothetical protein
MKTNTIPLYERNNYGTTALYATGPLAAYGLRRAA